MAQDNLGTLWKRVLLYAPDTPPLLAKRLVIDTHDEIVSYHYWTELRADFEFQVEDAYTTGTVAVTQGSTTVTGTGTTWTAAMTNRQIQFVAEGQFYTITRDSDTQLTLDRAWVGEDLSGSTYRIVSGYIELPQNFGVLEVVRDRTNSWKLTTQFFNQEYLDRIDPDRTATGTPTIIVYAQNRVDANNNQIPRIELWPLQTDAKTYEFRYRKITSLSSDSDVGLEIVHADTYLWGVLSKLALWPGTREKPNPYFSVEQFRELKRQFDQGLHEAWMRDIDRDQRMITYGMADDRHVPIDAKYIQSHGF